VRVGRALAAEQAAEVAPIPVVDVVDGEVHEAHLGVAVEARVGECVGGVLLVWIEARGDVVGKHIGAVVGRRLVARGERLHLWRRLVGRALVVDWGFVIWGR
jgi:hypothetical protein